METLFWYFVAAVIYCIMWLAGQNIPEHPSEIARRKAHE